MVTRNILPADPKPKHYELCITPDFEAFTFEGSVVIDLVAAAPCSAIVVNYNDMTFKSATVTAADGSKQVIVGTSIALDEVNMRATIPLATPVVGAVVLAVEYTGVMNDKMCGFYRAKYTVDGKPAFMGTTQFEAVDARRALPCWDEPEHKATFSVTLVVPSELKAVSNTSEISSELIAGGKKVVKFARTPVMSTYLLAWTIGHLEQIETTVDKVHGGKTLIRIFTSEGKIEQGRFALEVAAKVLPLYEKFFGSNYQLDKVDLLAIPDFQAGAMENWGMITYRETALLCDASSSATHRQWVALVVAHELAHQWFGNATTMTWWSELWLNESFATWVEFFAVDQLFPEWQIWVSFVHDDTGRALTLDALTSSHPVEVDVANAQEIDEIFDAISYSKGGSILRMAIEFIGMDAFQRGISAYLKHFEYKNATTADLWDFLGRAAGRDLTAILAPWTSKIGYPILSVEAAAGGAALTITQNRFLSNGPAPAEEDQTVWPIPLNILPAGQATHTAVVIDQRTNTVPIPAGCAWVKVNANQGSFVRVKYSSELLAALVEAIRSGAPTINAIDRLSLVGDYHAFAQGAFVSTVDALKLLAAFSHETDPIVWATVAGLDSDIRAIVAPLGEDGVAALNKFFAAIYLPAFQRLGATPVEGEGDRVAQARATLLSRLAAAKEPTIVALCRSLFAARDTAPIPADLRGAVYAAEVAHGGLEAVEAIKAMLAATTDAMESVRLLRSLASVKDVTLVADVIAFAMSERVRSQDAMYVLMGLSANAVAQPAFVDFITSQFDALAAKFPGMIFGRIYKSVENLAQSDAADRLEAFWKTIDEVKRMPAERSFRQGVEGLRTRAAWAARDARAIVEYVSSLQ